MLTSVSRINRIGVKRTGADAAEVEDKAKNVGVLV